MQNVTRYHGALVLLHWTLAFLIIGALAFGSLKLVGIDDQKLGLLL